jgi:phosphoribosyl-AMP cyclohydrolase
MTESSLSGTGGWVGPRDSSSEVVDGLVFAPKFDAAGLVTCVTIDAESGDVLMVAHMNAQALARTLASGEAWYFSRSRQELWRKGATSGQLQSVVEMRVDCDQDAVLLKVRQSGAGACHTGRWSCFYRTVPIGGSEGGAVRLQFCEEQALARSEAGATRK